MPLPVPEPTISEAAVIGLAITDELFPKVRSRRIVTPQDPADSGAFEKRAAEQLDYSVDMTALMEEDEALLGCYAWSSAPDELIVTSVRFANKGVMAYVWGGLDGKTYDLSILAKTILGRTIQFRASITVSQSAGEALGDYRPPIMGTGADPAQSYLTDAVGTFLAPGYVDAAGVPLFPVTP